MDIGLKIRRQAHCWRGVTPEAIGAYLEALRQERKRFKESEFVIPRLFRLNDTARNDVLSLYDDEIRLGEFYFEQRSRRKEPGFDTWVFMPREERTPRYSWERPKGDVWTRTNGRVKAEIELDTSRTMTRVSLRLQNDSEQLTFYDPPTGNEEGRRFLRNEASIQAEVERLKQHADREMQQHLLPRQVAREQELLREVLLL